MESTGDSELLKRLARGDGVALKVLFERYFGVLAAVGTRICRDSDEGRDVAQRVFISLWEKRSALNVDGDLAPYLRKMAINESLGRQRTESRRQEIRDRLQVSSSTIHSSEEMVIAQETGAAIRRAIDQLPDKTRQIFVLSRFEEMSYREISEMLGISIKTVEYHMGKALLALRKSL